MNYDRKQRGENHSPMPWPSKPLKEEVRYPPKPDNQEKVDLELGLALREEPEEG